jgi:hypothetical protein
MRRWASQGSARPERLSSFALSKLSPQSGAGNGELCSTPVSYAQVMRDYGFVVPGNPNDRIVLPPTVSESLPALNGAALLECVSYQTTATAATRVRFQPTARDLQPRLRLAGSARAARVHDHVHRSRAQFKKRSQARRARPCLRGACLRRA